MISNYAVPTLSSQKVVDFNEEVSPLFFWNNVLIGQEASSTIIKGPFGRISGFDLRTKEKIWSTEWNNADWSETLNGVVYASVTETNGTTTVTEVDLQSGRKKVLYREPLPSPWR